jgi:cyclic pyranopterin phosphate synthase
MTTLTDSHGRRIDYLRLSLTDRCDLRCQYCIPKGFRGFEAAENYLTPDEIEATVAAFVELGVRRVRLTGGEPLTRKGVLEIAQRIRQLPGVEDLSLTTNGTRLKQYVAGLRQAGVDRLNISLDSLDPRRFYEITGHNVLSEVLAGIDCAVAEGFPLIKINMVLMDDVNSEEADAMVEYCMDRGLVLRFIEPMPMGNTGHRFQAANLDVVRCRLQARYDLVDGVVPGGGPARYLKSHDGKFSVGFITPLSQHFCATCNRVRLSAEGTLFTCLGENDSFDLGSMVRNQVSQPELCQAIQSVLQCKPKQHEFNSAPTKVVRVMSKTGG